MADKQPKQKVFLIVDALALLHRAFHAIPPLQDKTGRVVNAVYGFFSILIRAMNETHADYLAVTFDRKAPTFRHEAYKEYKAGRAITDKLGEGANMARRKREGCAGFRTAAMPKSAGRRPHPKGELVLDVSL